MKKYWLYDTNGWYVGTSVEAEERPADGFEFEPPQTPPGQWPRFNGVGWVVERDYRTETLDEAKQRVLAYLNNAVYIPTGNYPEVEVQTFDLQYQEAKRYVEDGVESELLSILAEAQGRSVDDLAQSIITKHEADIKANIEFVGKVQTLRHRVKKAAKKSHLPTEQQIIDFLKA